MPFTTSISMFINVAKVPPFCILPCSHLHGNARGRVCTKHDSQVLRGVLRLRHTCAMDVKVTQPHQDQPAPPAPDSGFSDTACEYSVV